MNEKYEINHKLAGSSERASIELTLKPAKGYFVKLNGLLDFDKKSANARITQNLMPGKGFDMIGGKVIWDGQKSALHLMISCQGENGDRGQSIRISIYFQNERCCFGTFLTHKYKIKTFMEYKRIHDWP